MALLVTIFILVVKIVQAEETAPKPFQNSDIERTLENGKVQKFDGDKFKIVPRVKKVVKKTKAKPKKKAKAKNRTSILVGHGALGNLRANGNRVETENGAVIGLQYMRDFTEDDYHLLIQVQTNYTVSVGVGLDF